MTQPKKTGDERGATMVEASLVFMLLITIILFFFDAARYYLTRALLIRGAQEAADLASRIPDFDIDTVNFAAASPETARFLAARNAVIQTALSNDAFANIIAPSTGSGTVKLQRVLVSDQYSDGDTVDEASDVLILRPGESSKRHPTYIFIDHPDRCSSHFHTTGCTGRVAGETMESLMRQFPIVVRLRATVDTILPFFGVWVVEATSVRWREQSARSGFKDAAFSTLPPLEDLSPPGGGEEEEDDDDSPPLVCETTNPDACESLGRCPKYCTNDHCCYCKTCGEGN